MAGMMGFAKLLRSSELNDSQLHPVQMIIDSGQKMMWLLNEILDVSKIEADEMHIVKEAVRLADTVGTCVDLLDPVLAQKGLSIQFDLDPTLPEVVVSDELRIRQIMLNLIGNAVKFTNSGMIRVAVRHDQDQPATMMLEVVDTGIGIARDQLDRVLTKF